MTTNEMTTRTIGNYRIVTYIMNGEVIGKYVYKNNRNVAYAWKLKGYTTWEFGIHRLNEFDLLTESKALKYIAKYHLSEETQYYIGLYTKYYNI